MSAPDCDSHDSFYILQTKIIMSAGSLQSEDDLVKRTVAAVSWDTLQTKALENYSIKSGNWGEVISGAYNAVRFLQIDDAAHTVLVARIPKLPEEGWTEDEAQATSRRLSSEIATMQFVEAHTKIPVPHIFHYSLRADGDGVGSPYMLMSKVDGVPLTELWDDMDDRRRHAVLVQVAEIYVELFSHRFEHIGSLFMRDENGQPTWYIDRMVIMPDPEAHSTITSGVLSKTFRSAFDFWTEFANGRLRASRATAFGLDNRKYEYMHMWILRSLIPSLFDTTLDTTGFPLCPGDFHTQNIMIVDGDTNPRISGVIDWEWSRTLPTSSVAQYPLFIVDNPHWEPDDPMRERNVRDQETFIKVMREAESRFSPGGDFPITRAFQSSYGVYLFEQVVQYPILYNTLFPKVVDYIYGEDASESNFFLSSVTNALFEGVLAEVSDLFDQETEVFEEAVKVLGKEKIRKWMDKAEFEQVIRDHSSEFPSGVVHEWLISL
ncbi:hypothetical protein FRC03_001333 [Tulasnella sp. 419]|nr:hypothetical protein FRC03_001333 [Tulasnella sp. 419]